MITFLRVFRQYDALTYHKPKCKQAKDDARAKAEKKAEKDAAKSGNEKTDDQESDAAREVAHTLLEMKNETGEAGQASPIPSTGPPQLAKRPDNPKAPGAIGHHHHHHHHHLPPSQKTPTVTSMPRLVPKPNVQSDSMPPLPRLQPKPGLPVLQPKPNAGGEQQQQQSAPNTPQGTPIKSNQRQPGSPQLNQDASEGKLVMAEQSTTAATATTPTAAVTPPTSGSSPQVGVKRPHSPFKPVQPATMESTQQQQQQQQQQQSSPSHATQNNAR